MIFKNRMLKTTAVAIAIFSMVTTVAMSYVHADSGLASNGVSIERYLTEGKYSVGYKVIYVNEHGVAKPDNEIGASHAKMVLDGETNSVEIKDGKIYLTVKYKESMHTMMTDYKFIVDGQEVAYTQEGTSYTIELNKADSVVEANVTVPMMGNKVTRFQIASDMSSILTIPEDNTESGTTIKVIKDGTYIVKNTVSYRGDGNSDTGNTMARKVLEENSTIEVKDSKIKATITFDQAQYMFLGDFRVSVDGNEANLSIDKESRSVSFEMPSIDSEVVVTVKVTIMGKDVSFATEFDKSNLVYEDVVIEDGNEGTDTENPGTGGSDNDNKPGNDNTGGDTNSGNDTNNGGSTNDTSRTVQDGTYTVKNNVVYVGTGNSETGNNMARQVLEENSKIEVKDGKINVTLTFAKEQYSFLGDFRVSVDGKNVELDVNKSNRTISFEIPSIDSEVLVTVNVTIMGRDVSFKTTFDKSSLVFGDTTTNTANGNSDNTTNDSTNDGSTNTDDTKIESVAKKGKLYTIKNTVSHSSQTGKEMARKYLNSTSKVEIIDGQTYVTLTFTGSSFMQNHAIYVNGSKVSHTVVAKSGDSVSLRFKVSELSDSIKVGMHVIPMSKDIEFGVTLLEDTLTFVKDFDVNADGSLPQTGSVIGSNITIGAGAAMMVAAGVIARRKRK